MTEWSGRSLYFFDFFANHRDVKTLLLSLKGLAYPGRESGALFCRRFVAGVCVGVGGALRRESMADIADHLRG